MIGFSIKIINIYKFINNCLFDFDLKKIKFKTFLNKSHNLPTSMIYYRNVLKADNYQPSKILESF